MSKITTRLEKIEHQARQTTIHASANGKAIRNLVDGIDATDALREARDQLATIAKKNDRFAQYWLNAAAVMLGEVEPPNLFQQTREGGHKTGRND